MVIVVLALFVVAAVAAEEDKALGKSVIAWRDRASVFSEGDEIQVNDMRLVLSERVQQLGVATWMLELPASSADVPADCTSLVLVHPYEEKRPILFGSRTVVPWEPPRDRHVLVDDAKCFVAPVLWPARRPSAAVSSNYLRSAILEPRRYVRPPQLPVHRSLEAARGVFPEERIGAGANGEVWRGRAFDRQTGELLQDIILKRMFPHARPVCLRDRGSVTHCSSPIASGKREIRIGKALQSMPYVSQFLFCFTLSRSGSSSQSHECQPAPDDDLWLVFEDSGDSLHDILYDLDASGVLLPSSAWSCLQTNPDGSLELYALLLQLVRALASIQWLGILHRDIKPSNVFVRPSGRGCLGGAVRLGDWGSAVNVTNVTQGYEDDLRGASILEATLHYAPWEVSLLQASPFAREFPFSYDAWSLGMVLLELLWGRPPAAALSDLSETRVGRSFCRHSLCESALRPPVLRQLRGFAALGLLPCNQSVGDLLAVAGPDMVSAWEQDAPIPPRSGRYTCDAAQFDWFRLSLRSADAWFRGAASQFHRDRSTHASRTPVALLGPAGEAVLFQLLQWDPASRPTAGWLERFMTESMGARFDG